MRIKGSVALAALAAAAVTVGVGPAATAERTAAPKQNDSHVVMLAPNTDKQTRAAGGGGRGHDLTGDGIPDILARQWGSALVVYENSGEFDGTATYQRATFINDGWGSFSWIGSADLNGDGFGDAVSIDVWGSMWVTVHSGQFAGTRTLEPGRIHLGSGWHINDMVYVYDYNGDGFDDVLARRAGTGESYVYFNNGGIDGTSTFQAPVLFMAGGFYDDYQGIADVTMDGSPDFVYVSDGYLYMIQLNGAGGALLGYGWDSIDTIVFTDVDNDGRDDILGRRASDGSLFAYRHSGIFAPVNGQAYATYPAAVLVGTNWHINDILT